MSDEILKSFLDPRRLQRLEDVARNRTSTLTVVLDRVHNAHNISAVLRSADAFGLSDVHVIGELEVSQGIALGTNEWLRIHQHQSAGEACTKLMDDGFQLVVTAPEPQADRLPKTGAASLPVYELPFHKKLALVFGNEKSGVSQELFEAATLHAFIPMLGFVESFNISVACAICLFCSTVGISGSNRRVAVLDEEERQRLMSEWLMRNFRHADRIERDLRRRSEHQRQEADEAKGEGHGPDDTN